MGRNDDIHWSAKRVGVTVVQESPIIVECERCEQRWSPSIRPQSKGQLYRGWRRCPNGCNKDKLSN